MTVGTMWERANFNAEALGIGRMLKEVWLKVITGGVEEGENDRFCA